MIAVRISPDLRMAVVGAPSYFADHPKPRAPKELTEHACINLRLPTYGGFYVWEFEKGGKETKVRVDGPLAFNSSKLVVEAAIVRIRPGLPAGGPRQGARQERQAGPRTRRLVPPFSGYYLYYPSRRQPTPAFTLLVEALRHRR